MTTMALLNMFCSLGGDNISDHGRQFTLALERTNLDSTAFGDGWMESTGGLKSGTLTIELLDDFADESIDEIIWDLFNSATGLAAFIVRPDTAAVSTSNPNYSGSIFVAQHTLGGTLNEMGGKSLTFPTSGTVSRATA